jgi:hypothetical protein
MKRSTVILIESRMFTPGVDNFFFALLTLFPYYATFSRLYQPGRKISRAKSRR